MVCSELILLKVGSYKQSKRSCFLTSGLLPHHRIFLYAAVPVMIVPTQLRYSEEGPPQRMNRWASLVSTLQLQKREPNIFK